MDTPPQSGAWLTAAVVALAVGLWLRLTALEVHSLWFDEGGTLAVALAADPFEFLRLDRHPPLSFLAFRAWVAAFGASDLAVRVLPALVSSASLILFAIWMVRWSNRAAAWSAIALFACSPYQVWFGQEVRMYVFVELGVLVAMCGYEWSARRVGLGSAVVALGVAFAFGNHYLGAIVAPTLVVLAWVDHRCDSSPRRRAIAVSVAACVGTAVWAPWLIEYLPSQSSAPWGTNLKLGWLEFAELAPRLLVIELDALPAGWRWLAFPFAGLVWVALVSCAWRARTERSARVALIAAFVPIAAALCVHAITGAGFQARYLIAAAPGMTAAIAVGFASWPRVAPRVAAVALLVAASFAHSVWLRSANHREDYRTACAELIERWRPGDRVFSATGTIDGFSEATPVHYLRAHPDVSASFVRQDGLARFLERGLEPGVRLHVIQREAEYSQWQMRLLETWLRCEERLPMRTRIQLSTWVPPTP